MAVYLMRTGYISLMNDCVFIKLQIRDILVTLNSRYIESYLQEQDPYLAYRYLYILCRSYSVKVFVFRKLFDFSRTS
jgi:hypothetical protein